METVIQVLKLIFQLLPLIKELVALVQGMFGSGTGEIKKELVQGLVMDALATDSNLSPVLAAHPQMLEALVSSLIDRQVKAMKALPVATVTG